MTLGAAGAAISGDLGPMKNPFSTASLTLIQVRYYSVATGGCATSTATASTSTYNPAGFPLQFDPGAMAGATIDTSVKVVGDASIQNVATFKFKPQTMISPYGGVVSITSPAWYTSTRRALQMYQDRNFNCLSNTLVLDPAASS